MNDLATLNKKPRPITVDGRTYLLYPLTLGDYGEIQAWIDSQQPDPYAAAAAALRSGMFTQAQQQFILRSAAEVAATRRALIGTPEADAIIESPAGVKFWLSASIRKGDPSFSDDDAAALFDRMTLAEIRQVTALTEVEHVLTGEGADPKAAAGETTPPGTTTHSSG